MANYANITKSGDPLSRLGGYKDKFFFAPVSDFTSVAKPTISGTPALGDYKKITSAHTFTAPKGFYAWDLKKKSYIGKSAPIGEEGLSEYTYEFNVLGDGPEIQEQMERLQVGVDEMIVLAKDSNCLDNDTYVQLGDECYGATFTVEFDSQNPDGTKQWKVTVKSLKRYFYTGTVTLAA